MKNIQARLQTNIDDMVFQIQDNFAKIGKEIDPEYIEIMVSMNLFKAIGNYLLDTDKIISINVKSFPLRIEAVIERDNKQFNFETEQILASGLIQCLHYRYIVKTSVRKISNNKLPIYNKLNERKKTLNKIEKLENKIETQKMNIKKLENKIENMKFQSYRKITKDIDNYKYYPENTNFKNEEEWKQWIADCKNEKIKTHKEKIKLNERNLQSLQKDLDKFLKKLEKLENE